ncbi:hypothetical protein ONE63_010556 [Megalurothrips usitatus]|uniref:Uncharacterized protein n=1 Tax=Megalurothrips usitatus TaxID=439358 RepID=A0AAV7XKM3_9NEOP|nr:hypothetical protein ONE63_010556 [Megalurothrips usitatus]
MSPLLFVLFLCAFVSCLLKFMRSRPPMFPPGPPRLPVFGGYLHLLAYNYRYTHKGILAMAARYRSPVLGMYFGSSPTVIAADFASTREMLLKAEFQGRPDIFTVRLRSFGEPLGIFFTDGPLWAAQRRFSLRHLRDHGFGRRFPATEAGVEEEIRTLLDVMRAPVGSEKELVRDGQVLLPDLLYAGFVNAILEVLTGERLAARTTTRCAPSAGPCGASSGTWSPAAAPSTSCPGCAPWPRTCSATGASRRATTTSWPSSRGSSWTSRELPSTRSR